MYQNYLPQTNFLYAQEPVHLMISLVVVEDGFFMDP